MDTPVGQKKDFLFLLLYRSGHGKAILLPANISITSFPQNVLKHP